MPQSKDSSSQLFIIAVTLVAAATAGWFILNKWNNSIALEQNAPRTEVKNAFAGTAPTGADLPSVSRSLQLATMAFDSGHLVEPTDASAMHFYQQVLSREPNNDRALRGLSRITTEIVNEANNAIAEKDYEQVGVSLIWLNRLLPGSAETLAIQKRLSNQVESRFYAVDQAIRRGDFTGATQLANSVQAIPGTDLGRVNQALSSIADAQSAAAAAQTAPNDVTVTVGTGFTENYGLLVQDDVSTESAMPSQRSLDAGISESPEPNYNTATASENLLVPGTVEIITPAVAKVAKPSIATLLSVAGDRVNKNQMFTPPDDSALYYYEVALDREPTNEAAKRGLQNLVQYATAAAFERAQVGDWEGADRALVPVSNSGFAENAVEETRKQIHVMRVAELAATPANIKEFEIERVIQPVYPTRSIVGAVEGRVRVSFLVTENGTTNNIEVLEAPRRHARLFSEAAVTAISQWRFKPMMVAGEPISRRTETTVKFELTD